MNVDIYRRRFSELHGILVTAYDVDGVRYVSTSNFAKVMGINTQKVQKWIGENHADAIEVAVPADRRGSPSRGYPEDVFTAFLDEFPQVAVEKWDKINTWKGAEEFETPNTNE